MFDAVIGVGLVENTKHGRGRGTIMKTLRRIEMERTSTKVPGTASGKPVIGDQSPTPPAQTRSRRKNEDHPSGDNRFKLLETSMKKLRYQPDSLIEVLHNAQGLFGYLNSELLLFVAHSLKLPPSRVYGVATFYHFFTLEPRGRHSCTICMGTACYVKGAGAVLAAVEQVAGVKDGMTTSDGNLTLSTARCLGACGIAPAVVYDGQVAGRQTPENAIEKLKEWEADNGKE